MVIVICAIVASCLQFDRKERNRLRQAAKREQPGEEDAGTEADVIVTAITPNVTSATQLQLFPLNAAKLSSRFSLALDGGP